MRQTVFIYDLNKFKKQEKIQNKFYFKMKLAIFFY